MTAPATPWSEGPELRAGALAPVLDIGPLDLTDVVRYAGASGDFNPVHHDPDRARSLGNPDVFAMGMLPGAMLGTYAAAWLAPLRVRDLRLRFVDRVWPGESLACGGEVLAVEGAGDAVAVRARLWLRGADGADKVRGACTATAPHAVVAAGE